MKQRMSTKILRLDMPPEDHCVHCGGRVKGRAERVTYVGAPDGGYAVHKECVLAFFQWIDEHPFGPIPRTKKWRLTHEGITRGARAALRFS
jgi:hypothetical protein